jgi:hypothetical protein
MVISIVLIAQQWVQELYKAGIVLLFVSVLLNMAVSNVPHHHGVRRTLTLSAIFFAIVALVFAVSILIVPVLYQLGR